jgi:Sec-independent protein translocase protein TatA
MTNWLFIGGAILVVFAAKCIKEIADVRAMGKMAREERCVVLERRNFYDNHA